MRTTLFVDILLPLAIPKAYTYRVPATLNEEVNVGCRVVVQFGKRRLYTGIIEKVHETPPQGYEAKYIESVVDKLPVVNDMQLKLWYWLAEYYMCTIGEVMSVAMPGGLKLSSETSVLLNDEIEIDMNTLDDKEYLVVEALQIKMELSLEEIAKIINAKNVHSIVKRLIEIGIVCTAESIKERYKPKFETYISLAPEYHQEHQLKTLFETLGRAPKQVATLLAYIHHSEWYQNRKPSVMRSLLLSDANVSSAALDGLIDKKILLSFKMEKGRLASDSKETYAVKKLSEAQQIALIQLQKGFETFSTGLLHGVTSSGKTELYIHLIEEQLNQGKQVLYLLPEIALTTQIINRLKNHFGNRVGVYHSKFNEHERVEIWQSVILPNPKVKFDIVLGARSALFLPFNNLGLIIADEEHDSSYKQQDPNPRYHARDAAYYLAKLHNAKLLLGSATPSLETVYNVSQQKIFKVALNERYKGIQLPELRIADLKRAQEDKTMRSHFTDALLDEIGKALKNKEQVILFQNRRGFSVWIECQACNHIPSCTNCDVHLVYHKKDNFLKCHYCGFHQPLPRTCPACGTAVLKLIGFGTEKIEDELSIFFPEARIARMDLDTTRSRNNYYKIISDFEDRKTDILVGTQMITKGLDFDNVSLVGVLNADSLLNFPDYRAHEKAFQTLLQVAGRAGRKNKKGTVIIQTRNAEHPVLKFVMQHQFKEFYSKELSERQEFKYPPYYRLIEVTVKNKQKEKVDAAALFLINKLRASIGNRALGPHTPEIERINNYYIQSILIKVEKEASIKNVKGIIQESIIDLKKQETLKSSFVAIDVDPY